MVSLWSPTVLCGIELRNLVQRGFSGKYACMSWKWSGRHELCVGCLLLSLPPVSLKQHESKVALNLEQICRYSKERYFDKTPNDRWILWQKLIGCIHNTPFDLMNSAEENASQLPNCFPWRNSFFEIFWKSLAIHTWWRYDQSKWWRSKITCPRCQMSWFKKDETIVDSDTLQKRKLYR